MRLAATNHVYMYMYLYYTHLFQTATAEHSGHVLGGVFGSPARLQMALNNERMAQPALKYYR